MSGTAYFFLCLVLLVAGYAVYGMLAEKIFGVDRNRPTPAQTMADGMDYVPMPMWKIYLIQFLNIAGLGPVFGPILGAQYGPAALIWVVFGAIFAGAPEAGVEALRIFGENIGMAFQMVDDALDCAPEEATGKPTGGDLREGKLTPPLQMYRDALDDATRASFDKAFEEGAFTQAEVDAICLAVRERGYDARTREEAEGYLSLARTALDAVPDAKERDILLQMADYVRDRKK